MLSLQLTSLLKKFSEAKFRQRNASSTPVTRKAFFKSKVPLRVDLDAMLLLVTVVGLY